MGDVLEIVQLVHAPRRRGAEVFARDLAVALRRLGHEVTTVYLYRAETSSGEALLDDVGSIHLDARERSIAERLLGLSPRLVRALRRTLSELDPDVVQANGGNTLKYAGRARRPGARWKLLYRNIGDPRVWLGRARERFYYRYWIGPRLDGIAAISARTVEPLLEIYGPGPALAVLPTGVDTESFVPSRRRAAVRRGHETPPDVPVAIAAASLTPEKRVDRLLRSFALARAKSPDLHLWIAGDGPLRGELESLARDLGIAPFVRFLGLRTELADDLAAADLAVLTSDTEGVPGALLEAASLGLPAVATRVGGVPDCVSDGETGLLVRPGDEPVLTAALGNALAELANDGERRRNLGAAARRRVEREFSLPSIARGYVALYRRMLGEAPAPSEDAPR